MKGKEKDSPRNSGSFIRSKSKKSEGGKHGDRLSIFGGTFAGPRSKHRKPPPRYVVLLFFSILCADFFFTVTKGYQTDQASLAYLDFSHQFVNLHPPRSVLSHLLDR